MHKRQLYYYWTRIQAVSYWYFLAGFIIFGSLFVYSFRQNNIKMIELRQAVFEADQQNKDLEGALFDLRSHVYGHMNTSLTSSDNAIRPPIQLKHQYERLVAVEQTRTDQANAALRAEAEAVCAQHFPVTANVTGREPCIQGIINERGISPRPIPKELYQFDFVSPVWSPDVAGFSLLLTGLFGILFVSRYGLELWLRRRLKKHA